MKRILSTILLLLGAAFGTAAQQEFFPAWEPGFLDIHHIATGQGDCAFAVFPDGTTMLIDAGDLGKPQGSPPWTGTMPSDSLRPGEWIVRYLQQVPAGLPDPETIDYVFLTHLHADHVGSPRGTAVSERGYKLSGVTDVGEAFRFGTLVDRGYPAYDFPSRKKIRKDFPFFDDYYRFVTLRVAEGMKAERFVVGSDTQFRLLHDPKPYRKDFSIRNLCGAAEVWTGKGLGTRRMYEGDPMLFDENVNSCGILLRYGPFTYYNCGDLCGGNHPRYASHDRWLEPCVAPLCGKVTVMKCDHHGFLDSSDAELLTATRPDVFIVCASNANHPHESTLRRLTDPLLYKGERSYYVTTDAARETLGEEAFSVFKPSGHTVVRVYPGGTSYEMFVLDVFSGDYRVRYRSGPVGADIETAADYVRADPGRAASNFRAYPFEEHPVTAPPKGYKPFYISHYSRHGSRFHTTRNAFKGALGPLDSLEAAGLLNGRGRAVAAAIRDLDRRSPKDSLGQLSARGRREQRRLAAEMVRAWPDVFRGARTVRAESTTVDRSRESMEAFTGSLAALRPQLAVSCESSRSIEKVLNNKGKMAFRGEVDRIRDSLAAATLHPGVLLHDWTRNAKKASRYIPNGTKWETAVYESLAIGEAMDADSSLLAVLPEAERLALWRIRNLRGVFYHGRSVPFGAKRLPASRALVEQIVADADEALADGNVAADLRFGHDSGLTALLALIGVEGFDRWVDVDSSDAWNSSRDMCMASNFELVFYRNRSGDVLVKPVLNGREVRIPALGYGPYYPWERLRAHLAGL